MTLRSALFFFAIPPLIAFAFGLGALAFAMKMTSDADDAQDRIERAMRLGEAAPAVQAAALLLPGNTAGLAASALQAQILRLLAGGDLQEITPLASQPEGALTRIEVSIRLSGDENSVMQELLSIESAEPLIFINALKIVRQDSGILAVELDLAAYTGRVPS